MKSEKQKKRRQFLKNTSLAALSLGLVANLKAKPKGYRDKPALMCEETTLDLYGEGPFYTENPPTIMDSQLAEANETGTRMIISGRVYNLDCSEYIPDTIIDVWHADDAGQYDNAGFNLRGVTTSNDQGFYMFETIKPGKYLNGNMFRPSHIHFRITPPGFDLLTTQLYFAGDADLSTDAASSVSSGQFDATHRIIELTENSAGVLEGTWDIVINGEGIMTGTNDLHINKGMIYKTFPNPFTDSLTINYGVFRQAKVSLLVYNTEGKLVANLEEKTLSPEKYEAVWKPDPMLPNGHYFIALKINDLQVHYVKVVRQR